MSGQDPRPPRVLALDLEGTLISNAFSVIARPGLHEFLTVCNELFPRIVMITAVSEPRFRRIARLLVEEGLAPTWFEDVEYVRWHGSTKDLSFISGAAHADVVLIDDFREYVHPGQEASWVEIACFDPPYPSDDCELQRLAEVLRARVDIRGSALLERIAKATSQSLEAQELLFAELREYDTELAELMLAVFGSVEVAMSWFTRSRCIDAKTPCSALADGKRESVVDQLMRMEYGVYF